MWEQGELLLKDTNTITKLAVQVDKLGLRTTGFVLLLIESDLLRHS